MPQRARVVIGVYGTRQDAPTNAWRPTQAVCTDPSFAVHRLELLHFRGGAKRAMALAEAIEAGSPHGTEVRLHRLSFDPFDYAAAMAGLRAFAEAYPWAEDEEEYFVHGSTGTHFLQTAFFLLVQGRVGYRIPGRLVFTRAPEGRRRHAPVVVDLRAARFAPLDPLASGRATVSAEAVLKGEVETENATFNARIEELCRVAERSTDPILLTGETGVGKTFLAQQIYAVRREAGRVGGRLCAVNCATLRGDLVTSTLFGHPKGAFTGATSERAGLLKAADGGLLFLDEVAELDPATQAMLLKALEEKVFVPLGADVPVESDFQLVAATNRDLLGEVRAGRFREDLYARLAYWTCHVPPLRERPEDFEPLIGRLLAQWAQEREPVRFTARAKSRFLAFARSPEASWPWNLRDLIRALRRMACFADDGTLGEPLVAAEVERLRSEWAQRGRDAAESEQLAADEALVREHLSPARLGTLHPIELPSLAHLIRTCRRAPSRAAAGRALFQAGNPSDRVNKALARVGLQFDDLRAPTS